MHWLFDEVFGPALDIGDRLAEADAADPHSIGFVFQSAEVTRVLLKLAAGLKRADAELLSFPSDVAHEVRFLQRVFNGAVGTISFSEAARYFADSGLRAAALRGWRAVIRATKPLPFPSAAGESPTEVEPTQAEAAAEVSRRVKPKRSTERGEGLAKLIAALTKHHRYADGGCLNLEPIGNNEMARLAGVDKATASAFFKQQFRGHAKYKAACADAALLASALKMLNGEFSPHLLYGAKPADERERDEE